MPNSYALYAARRAAAARAAKAARKLSRAARAAAPGLRILIPVVDLTPRKQAGDERDVACAIAWGCRAELRRIRRAGASPAA